ncbi:MAG: ZIP family metal transporter [Deltaproteobacteria bacterium]|nr:ZIP family metal transporter [Deltaproteobacteria bacterium]MBW2378995.1 ZIP family metal transporter [Deltaproteobacteria bacterium]RLB39308.1 MAG: ZIP family metal transporter [Deltaproteobacteria bacterium]
MTVLAWIVLGGVLMTAIALTGSITLLLKESTLERIIMPLVAFAAGSLLGGAFFHMLPSAAQGIADPVRIYAWTLAGFTVFFALEQILHWHHCRRASSDCRKPLTHLILVGDGLHNFLGGLGVGGVFLVDIRLGIAAWIAAAAHEVPQELGDFGVLIHGGWGAKKALLFNLLSGLTFLIGGVAAWLASATIDVSFLVPFAAGNFIYIGASDLVPEVNKHGSFAANAVSFACFIAGLALLWLTRLVLTP